MLRIALVSDTTVRDLVHPLTGVLAEQGVQPEFSVVEGEAVADLADAVYPTSPELTILILHARELAPELFRARTLLSPVGERVAICDRVSEALVSQVRAIRAATGAPVLVADFPVPVHSPLGIQDASVELGLRACIRRINDALEDAARGLSGVTVFARSAAAARLGANHVEPADRWRVGREESAGLLYAWARELGRHVSALRDANRTVLVLDLDNTLWGGAAGREVVLGPSGAGRPWYDFQQVCLDLWERGVLLAIAAKGDRRAAMSVLRSHPHALLREQHFSAIIIGEEDKATACLKIAGQLGVGLNKLALFEDNPVEREWVSQALPEVEVIPVPRDPARYTRALAATSAFEAVTPSLPNPRVVALDRRAAA